MKTRRVCLFGFICLITGFTSLSQTPLDLHISGADGKPVSNAIVIINKTASLSNESGNLKVSNYVFDTPITIKKLGFIDTTLAIEKPLKRSDSLEITVKLRTKVFLLNEIPVFTNKLREINPQKAAFIYDYEIEDTSIIELLSDNYLILLNIDGHFAYGKKIFSGTENIVKDPFHNLTILTSRYARNFDIGSSDFLLDTSSIAIDKFNWTLKYCDAVSDSFYFIRKYKDLNQTVDFIAISKRDNHQYKLLKEVTSEERKAAVKANARKVNGLIQMLKSAYPKNEDGVMGDIGWRELEVRRMVEREALTHRALYERPSFNTLKVINDSIYLFAFDIDTVFLFDQSLNLVRKTFINYHHLRFWSSELIVNENSTRAYAKFNKDSKTFLAEIDLISGKLFMPFFKIDCDSNFPKKIKIMEDRVFFLKRQPDNVGYSLYTQNLGF